MEYDILPGRGRENAKKALALAEERGFDPVEVLTTRDGYRVPVNVEDAPTKDESTEDETKQDESEDKSEDKPAARKTARTRTAKKE